MKPSFTRFKYYWGERVISKHIKKESNRTMRSCNIEDARSVGMLCEIKIIGMFLALTSAINSNTLLLSFTPNAAVGSSIITTLVPKDVALAVKFLLDSSNSFLNGCILDLSGGIRSRLHDPL